MKETSTTCECEFPSLDLSPDAVQCLNCDKNLPESHWLYPIKFNLPEQVEDYDFVQPSHYQKENGRQTIDLMVERFGIKNTAIFCEINAFKYADRKGKKPGEDEEREYQKQLWYENKAKELYSQL